MTTIKLKMALPVFEGDAIFFVKRIWFEIHIESQTAGMLYLPALISWVHRK